MSECRSVEQCRGSVGAVSRAVSVDIGVGVSSSVGAVSEQCIGQCRGFLTVGIHGQCRAVSECRSVGVSECRSVRVSSSVGMSGCRSVGVSEVSDGCQVGDSVKQ